MTVHPAPGAYHGTLVNALLFHCRDNLSGIGGVKRQGLCIVLIKIPAGCLWFAKNDLTHRGLAEQFAEHSIERTYHAVVLWCADSVEWANRRKILDAASLTGKMAVIVSRGVKLRLPIIKRLKPAVWLLHWFSVIWKQGEHTKSEVHMAHVGCHLIGDQLYEKES